jgi:tungstate transport system ATP-binding protein
MDNAMVDVINHLHHSRTILPLKVDRLAFRAGEVDVLVNASFRIEAGSRTVVLGPNGAGKSVLLRLLHGLLMPTDGSVTWSQDSAVARHAQAMVFQRPVMLRRTVRENIEFALATAASGNGGVRTTLTQTSFAPPSASVRERADAILARAGLAHLAARPARLCSGGEQQRVALARAWALVPEVLFLDEPTASLDPAATRAIEDSIHAMHATGTTIVMTTHDLAQARRIANRILFLHRGRLLEDTPAADFFNQPATPEAQAFIRGELIW